MIRVFPRKTKWTPTDDLSFIGDPPLFRPDIQPVYISCAFTWDILESERLKRSWQRFYPDVYVGGPAYDDRGGEFVPGRFVKEGVTITSRGCTKECDWCFAPGREGWTRELEIKPGWNVNDNNLLACSMKHIKSVFEMLKKQKKPIVFSGGLDAELFTKEHAELIRSINLGEAWFSCDYPGAVKNLERVAELLPDYNNRKKRCYVMIGFNGERIQQAERRLRYAYNIGFDVFAMLYRSKESIKRDEWSTDWRQLQKTWCRPAAYRTKIKRECHKGGSS